MTIKRTNSPKVSKAKATILWQSICDCVNKEREFENYCKFDNSGTGSEFDIVEYERLVTVMSESWDTMAKAFAEATGWTVIGERDEWKLVRGKNHKKYEIT